MINVGSLSGGRTSAYMAVLMVELGLNPKFVFMDTTAEHPMTYSFIRNVVKHFDIDLTCLRVVYGELGSGNTYEEISIDDIGHSLSAWRGMTIKYGNPSVVSPYCTSRMKTEIHDKWCNDKFGKGEYTTWIGIRADETRRAKQKEGIRYLCDISNFYKQDILDWWKNQPSYYNCTEGKEI